MSATVFWQPISGRPLRLGGAGVFIEVLKAGSLWREKTATIGEADTPILAGMAAATTCRDHKAAFLLLAEEAAKGPIRVWARY